MKIRISTRLAMAVAVLVLFVPNTRTAAASENDGKASAAGQHFFCSTNYTLQQCHEDVAVLRKALAKYPVAELGDWTWILVRSGDWKSILLPRRMDPESPAFTYFEKRETFLEEALVTQVSGRSGELLKQWGMTRTDLLDFAIAHELGHALCKETDEGKAKRVARTLQQQKPFACEFKHASTVGRNAAKEGR